MADAQSLNATFCAFRKREKGGVLIGATIAYLVIGILLVIAFILPNVQAVFDYVTWAGSIGAASENMKPGEAPSLEAMMPPASVMALGPALFGYQIVAYILFASYEAACLRWMIRGETGGLFGLTLGADTWRVYFTYWLWFFLFIVLALVGVILFMGVGGAVGIGAQGGGGDVGGAVSIGLALALVWLLGVVYVAVRLAPAAATSVARRKFAFFEAWTVSRGRFFALLGAFVLLLLIYFVFTLIASTGLSIALGMAVMSEFGQAGPQTPEQLFRAIADPRWLAIGGAIVLVMTAAAMTLYVALFGVNARAAALALEEGKITQAE